MQVFDNSPSSGFIRWSSVNISYKGTVYNIPDGSTDFRYVYWKYSDPLVFYGSDTFPTLGDDDLLVFLNKNGIHLTVPTTTVMDGSLLVPESILANALAANCVTSDKIAANAITASKIAADAVGANAIAANAVAAEHLAANAVTASKIAADAVGADAIAANAILAEHIASNVITANKMAIGDFTNLSRLDVDNPGSYGTKVGTDGYKYINSASAAYASLDLARAEKVEFKVGDSYYFAFYGYRSATVTQVQAYIRYYFTDGTYLNAGSCSYFDLGTTPKLQTCIVNITTPMPTDKELDCVYFRFQKNNTSSGYYLVRDVELRKMYGGSLIVDGSINANHIETNGLVGATIKTATSGARVEMNSSGLKQYDSANNVIVNMSGGNATFKGDINTTKDAYVGKNLYLGSLSDHSNIKYLYFNDLAYISGGWGAVQAGINMEAEHFIINDPSEFYYRNGTLSLPKQPFARAYINSNFSLTAGAWHTMPASVEVVDAQGDYNTSTSRFTCPTDGNYLISGSLVATTTATAAPNTITLAVYKNGVFASKIAFGYCYNDTIMQTAGSTILRCSQNDYLEVRVTSSRDATMSNTANNAGNNFVAFALLH